MPPQSLIKLRATRIQTSRGSCRYEMACVFYIIRHIGDVFYFVIF